MGLQRVTELNWTDGLSSRLPAMFDGNIITLGSTPRNLEKSSHLTVIADSWGFPTDHRAALSCSHMSLLAAVLASDSMGNLIPKWKPARGSFGWVASPRPQPEFGSPGLSPLGARCEITLSVFVTLKNEPTVVWLIENSIVWAHSQPLGFYNISALQLPLLKAPLHFFYDLRQVEKEQHLKYLEPIFSTRHQRLGLFVPSEINDISCSDNKLWKINCGKFWKRWEYQTKWPAS